MPAALIVCGAACVCGGSGGWGWLVARQLHRRPAELAGMQVALEALRTEIGYAGTPLAEALRRAASVSHGPAAALCRSAARRLGTGTGQTPGEAWEAAVAEVDALSSWDATDLQAIGWLGPALGVSDAADQVRHITLCTARLRAAEHAARSGAERQARMWLYLGVLAGAALVLVAL